MTNHKDIIRLLKKTAVNAVLFPLRILPKKKNRIMFVNSLSFKYACNPKAIIEYLINKHQGEFEIFLAVREPNNYTFLQEKGITPVKYLSISYYFYMLTSKIIISNSGGYSFLPISSKQIVINTWHGGGAYKKGGLDVCDNTPAYIRDVKMFAKRTNYFITTCTEQTSIFERAYLLGRSKILEIGMPRNDIFFNPDIKRINEIKEKLGLSAYDKIVLYAPTFRKQNDDQLGDMVAGQYNIDVDLICSSLHDRFGGNWKFAYRLHPLITNRSLEQFKNAVNLSDYEDMQDLLLISDVLINDYSSSMWDFAFTNRPCFIFAYDLEHYRSTTSWYTPIEKWPFPIATSNESLKDKILCFNEEQYAEKVSMHLNELGCIEDGTACMKLYEHIKSILK